MFLRTFEINQKSLVAEIVTKDYRTADIFRKYDIGYCCGGNWPLEVACKMKGVDFETIKSELEMATRNVHISNTLVFSEWNIDFLVDYIINVHHQYLKKYLPETQKLLSEFVIEHSKKYTYLVQLEKQFDLLAKQLLATMQREEEVIFPYIRQIAHAHKDKEPYAALLVRTLRKPVEETMFKSHETITDIILSIRHLTDKYTTPEKACVSHKVVIAKLKELDTDLMQHFGLEQKILFPQAIAIEKELLTL